MFRANKIVVYKGRAYEMGVFYVNEAGQQINITGLTAHYLKIHNQDGSWIEKQCTNGFVWGLPLNQTYLGIYSFSSEETALFKGGPMQSAFLKLCYGENVVWQEIKNYLFVYPDSF